MDGLAAHLTLLGVAFLAATIVPGSSEVVLVAMVHERPTELISLFLVATIGNTAGSIVNWVLGRWFQRFAGRRWLPASQRQLETAATWFNKYGVWSLLFAWFPIVGDALTVIAGALKEHLGIHRAGRHRQTGSLRRRPLGLKGADRARGGLTLSQVDWQN